MEDKYTLSENELRSLAYFVVGVSSEGSLRGRDVSNRLSFAGKFLEGKMYPVENSGLTIGTLQKDLGQDKGHSASALVEAFQIWARAYHPEELLTTKQHTSVTKDLSRNGKEIKNQGNRAIDSIVKKRFDTFLETEDGRAFVHRRDMAQVDRLYNEALIPLSTKPVYKEASVDDQIILATIVAKGFNQSEVITAGLIRAMQDAPNKVASVTSLDDVRVYSQQKFTPAMREGRDAALRGSSVYIRLHHAGPGNPLREAWQNVINGELLAPSTAGADLVRPDRGAHHMMVKNLFLEPRQAIAFMDALEKGNDYGPTSKEKTSPAIAVTRTGFFASGPDFVQWNADGHGVAYVDGAWSTVERDQIVWTRQPDASLDIAIERDGIVEPMLHVPSTDPSLGKADDIRTLRHGMQGDDVRALQAQLAKLGFTDARGRPLHADGDFGTTTRLALQAFQHDHSLRGDGVAGPSTQVALRDAVQTERRLVGQPDAAYLRDRQHEDAMSAYGGLVPDPPALAPFAHADRDETAAPSQPSAFRAPQSDILRHFQHGANTPAPNDPRHPDNPNHRLYSELQRRVPDASEDRLLQFTAVCRANGVTVRNLSGVRLDETHMTLDFCSNDPMATPARVDLRIPPPQPVQVIAQIEQRERHEAQYMQPARMPSQISQNGPVLSGRGLSEHSGYTVRGRTSANRTERRTAP